MKKLKMASLIILTLSIFTAVKVQAEDLRGTWQVIASGHKGVWMVGIEDNEIFGASKWSCCPGFRVDRISGTISGNEITITRHIVGQGNTSGTQIYEGTISNGKITGTWSGVGGSGTWSAVISK